MAENPLIAIETKITHQEHTLLELNEALISQQHQIASLATQVEVLTERVRALSAAASDGNDDDAPPPHY